MTRESRLIVTLVVISGIGVAGLSIIAGQYRKSLARMGAPSSGGQDASARALRLVDGYLAARRAAKSVVDRHPGTVGQLTADAAAAFRTERENAFAARGLTYEDYTSVRAAWRTFHGGGGLDDQALVAVFRARRAELEAASLGAAEPLDDAIK